MKRHYTGLSAVAINGAFVSQTAGRPYGTVESVLCTPYELLDYHCSNSLEAAQSDSSG